MKKFFIIFNLIIVISCSQKAIDKIENGDNYLRSNFNKYDKVYTAINDTISSWIEYSLANVIYNMSDKEYQIDSLLVFNSECNRLYSNFLIRIVGFKDSYTDAMYGLGGAKIKGKWYFFFGITTYIRRETYQDSIYSPLSFDELSYLSRQELCSAYTINADGSITTNDSFFDFMYKRSGWGLPDGSSLEQLDSTIVAKTEEVRKMKIDPKELEDIKKEMARSVRLPEPKEETTLWQKIFGKEKKLFESDDWKEYLRKKYGKDVK